MTTKFKAGSCAGCGLGTDTGIAFQGEPEWAVAGLMQLGIGYDEALLTFRAALGLESELVPDYITVTTRVCAACARKAGFPVPVLLIDGAMVPCIRPGGGGTL